MTEAELNAAITVFRLETEDLIPAVSLKWYFNGGISGYVPYADEAEVLSVVGANWKPYMTVNVAGVDFWYLPDGSLANKIGSLSLLDGSVTLDKMADMATDSFLGRLSAGAGLPEVLSIAQVKTMLGITPTGDITDGLDSKVDKVTGYSLISAELLAKIHDNTPDATKVDKVEGSSLIEDTEKTRLANLKQNIYTISLPSGASVEDHLTDAVLPEGWILTAVGDTGKNLKIVHTLTGRGIATVAVKVTDDLGTRMLVPFRNAYSGILEPIGESETIIIEGFAPNYDLPLILILTFA